jgi:hypothetical protein
VTSASTRTSGDIVKNSDPDAWIGWTNDPAESTCLVAWLTIGPWRIYAWLPCHIRVVWEHGRYKPRPRSSWRR